MSVTTDEQTALLRAVAAAKAPYMVPRGDPRAAALVDRNQIEVVGEHLEDVEPYGAYDLVRSTDMGRANVVAERDR